MSNQSERTKKKNPDALAGAVGADLKKKAHGKIGQFRSMEYRIRAERATTLAHAICAAHPDDARQLLTAALIDLSAGEPPHTAFGDIREDARWWTARATPTELMEYMAEALRALGQLALCLTMRKHLIVTLFESLPIGDRVAFLKRTDATGQFVRRPAQ